MVFEMATVSVKVKINTKLKKQTMIWHSISLSVLNW